MNARRPRRHVVRVALRRVTMNKKTRLQSYCADLLAMKENEAFVWELFGRPRGEWSPVSDICAVAGIQPPPAQWGNRDLCVVWLAEPSNAKGFATVIFLAPAELWTTTGFYNVDRLLRRKP